MTIFNTTNTTTNKNIVSGYEYMESNITEFGDNTGLIIKLYSIL